MIDRSTVVVGLVLVPMVDDMPVNERAPVVIGGVQVLGGQNQERHHRCECRHRRDDSDGPQLRQGLSISAGSVGVSSDALQADSF